MEITTVIKIAICVAIIALIAYWYFRQMKAIDEDKVLLELPDKYKPSTQKVNTINKVTQYILLILALIIAFYFDQIQLGAYVIALLLPINHNVRAYKLSKAIKEEHEWGPLEEERRAKLRKAVIAITLTMIVVAVIIILIAELQF